jgi:hypothetical protein
MKMKMFLFFLIVLLLRSSLYLCPLRILLLLGVFLPLSPVLSFSSVSVTIFTSLPAFCSPRFLLRDGDGSGNAVVLVPYKRGDCGVPRGPQQVAAQ